MTKYLDIYSDLIKLAAQMAKGEGVPDWSERVFSTGTPSYERRDMLSALRMADEAGITHALQLRAIADRLSAEMRSSNEPCEQPPTDKMRLDWWESQHTLHNSLHLLYVVDGYDLEVIVDDRTVACYHGEDIRACIDAAMKGASRDASSVEVIDLRNVDFQPPF